MRVDMTMMKVSAFSQTINGSPLAVKMIGSSLPLRLKDGCLSPVNNCFSRWVYPGDYTEEKAGY